MNVECTACAARGTINPDTVPREGRDLTCPRCGKRFRVWQERSGVEVIQQRERMLCPNCGCEQAMSETCAVCGVVVREHIQAEERRRERERLEITRLRAEVRQVDSWYRGLFDRRLATLLVRVLSLLVGLALFMTCSMRSAERSRHNAENAAATTQSTRPPMLDDKGFKERFDSTVEGISEQIDRCFVQCYNYQTEWYHRGSQEHYLNPAMEEALQQIQQSRREVRTRAERLPTPTKPYWECYHKVKHLYNIYDDLYKLATDYRVHYHNLSDRLADLNGDYLKTREDLNACKENIR
jgi:predicted Zn finger-like uncharacterized protein